MISTHTSTEARESYLMGDPWSDQVSYTFDDYEMQENMNYAWAPGGFTATGAANTISIYNSDPSSWIIKSTGDLPTWTTATTIPNVNGIEHKTAHDAVNHPKHYTSHPSGVECIQVTQHYNFCVGNAIKYLWRAGLKTEGNTDSKQKQIEDLNKAIWYIRREIENLETNKYEQT